LSFHEFFLSEKYLYRMAKVELPHPVKIKRISLEIKAYVPLSGVLHAGMHLL